MRCPATAVVAAYGLRMLLLWLSHRGEDPFHPRFETVGGEAGLIGWSLANGRGFASPFPGYDTATAWLAPVYPLVCAASYKLANLHSYGALLYTQVFNCAFSAATCWPLHDAGKRIFNEKIGLAAAWVWVIFPLGVLMPLEWTWDQSLSALLLALLLSATLRLEVTSAPLHWSGYGLLWGIAALTNPTLCVLLPFLLVWVAWRRRTEGLRLVRLMARTALFFVLAVLPWTARNYFVLDGLTGIKSNFGLELWLGNNAAVKEIYSPELHPLRNFHERIQLILSGEPNYMRAKQREAIAFMRANPGRFLKLCWDRFVDTWAATYDSRVDPWVNALHLRRGYVFFCIAFSFVAFAGILLALRHDAWGTLPLALCVLVFPIPYYFTHTSLRYRHPVDPVMVLLAVYAIGELGRRIFARGQRRTSAPATRAQLVS